MGTNCSLYRLKRPELDFSEMSEEDVEQVVLDRAYVFDPVDADFPWYQKITGWKGLYLVGMLTMRVIYKPEGHHDDHCNDHSRTMYRLRWLDRARDFIIEDPNAQYVFVRDTYNWPHF